MTSIRKENRSSQCLSYKEQQGRGRKRKEKKRKKKREKNALPDSIMSQSREREKLLKLYISILPPEMEITFPTTACTWPSQCWGNNISKNKFVKTNLSHIRNPLILPNAHRQCIIVLAVGPTG